MSTTASKDADQGVFFVVAAADHAPTTADHESIRREGPATERSAGGKSQWADVGLRSETWRSELKEAVQIGTDRSYPSQDHRGDRGLRDPLQTMNPPTVSASGLDEAVVDVLFNGSAE
jgi:hypothetical protein